jgi:hypothetical protein
MRHRQRREPRAKAVGKQQLPECSVVLRARRGGPAGVEERGIGAGGLPRNLGDLVLSDDVGNGVGGIAEQRDDRCRARRRARSRSSS